MKADTASRTAQYMALFRALETRRPGGKNLFTDPYALHFLQGGHRLACRMTDLPFMEKIICRIIQRKIPGAQASGIARTRYIDDLLVQTIRDGARQVIILGAGFDMRAIRLDALQHLPVIEIDHPDTARFKLQTLRKISGGLPANTRYLGIDFNRQDLDSFFREQNIDRNIKTTLIWEGVSNYLNDAAVDRTFTLAGSFSPGSAMIFTYIDRKVLDEPRSFFGGEKLLADLGALEEKWTFGLPPGELSGYLAPFGLELREDKGAADYREQYMPERKSLLKGYEFYHTAMAVRK